MKRLYEAKSKPYLPFIQQGRPRNPEYEKVSESIVKWWNENPDHKGVLTVGPFKTDKELLKIRTGFRASTAFSEMPKDVKDNIRSRVSISENGRWLQFMARGK